MKTIASQPMDKNHFQIMLANETYMRIEVVAADSFRIRLQAAGNFRESALIRYGIWSACTYSGECKVVDSPDKLNIHTEKAHLQVDKRNGSVVLFNAHGEVRTSQSLPPWSESERGFGAEFQLAEGERFYGLGDESRECIQKRGHRANMWVANVRAYAPIPFLMSSQGWGLAIHSTWRHAIDIGLAKADRLRFWGRSGELDYYLFAGDSMAELLQSYTAVSGRPQLLPQWAYGLTFVCNTQVNAREMLEDALKFRREGIPCDLIGLEPGWMETFYDYSVDKKWHPDRFWIPKFLPNGGPSTFLGALERLGFKLSLWLCTDYDLSLHEERLLKRTADKKEHTVPGADSHPDDYEQDTALQYPIYMDKVTKREEPWYEHLRKFVGQGVSAFKLDGSRQVLDHPDRLWGNGMSDEEMHNLYPLLLAKQMFAGFKEQTGQRPMIYTAGGYTGIQQYAATWAGDTGGGPKPLVSVLNHGLSAHSNTSCDMDVFTPTGLHFGFLQPWSQVNSWNYWRHPWLLDKNMLAMFKMYAKLRYRLLPYIYAAAHVAARTGMPIVRAMPLAFPNDRHADNLLNQYMFGDFFLVGAFTEEIYLPEGVWIDYWTGKRIIGPANMVCHVPSFAGGPLFVRAGAIIPMWPEMDYVGEKLVECLRLRIYPHGDSIFTLFEDDGTSFAYEEGKVAETTFECSEQQDAIVIRLGMRIGSYEGMPERRSYRLTVDIETPPSQVVVNGKGMQQLTGTWMDRFHDNSDDLPLKGWGFDPERQAVCIAVAEDDKKCSPLEIRIERSSKH